MEECHPSFDRIFTRDSFAGYFKEVLLYFKLVFSPLHLTRARQHMRH